MEPEDDGFDFGVGAAANDAGGLGWPLLSPEPQRGATGASIGGAGGAGGGKRAAQQAPFAFGGAAAGPAPGPLAAPGYGGAGDDEDGDGGEAYGAEEGPLGSQLPFPFSQPFSQTFSQQSLSQRHPASQAQAQAPAPTHLPPPSQQHPQHHQHPRRQQHDDQHQPQHHVTQSQPQHPNYQPTQFTQVPLSQRALPLTQHPAAAAGRAAAAAAVAAAGSRRQLPTQRAPVAEPEPEPEPEEEGGGGAGLLAYLIGCGALDEGVAEDEEGGMRLREGAVAVQVDLMALLNAAPQLGCQLLMDPKAALWGLMDALYDEGLSDSPCPRLAVRPTQTPLPCQSVPELLASLCRYGPGPGGAATPCCCFGVVAAASALRRLPHSRSLLCPHCGTSGQVLEERGGGLGPGGGPCCDPAGALGGLQEDLSGRVMAPWQELELRGLSSAAPGGGCPGPRLSGLRVLLPDDLAGSVKVGDVVRVVGLARLLGPAPPGAAAGRGAAPATASVELEALSVAHVAPHGLWAAPGAATGGVVARSRQPLQVVCDLLTRLLGRPLEPLLALALAASAVAAGGGAAERDRQAGGGGAAAGALTATAAAGPAAPGAGGVLGAAASLIHGRPQISILLGCDPLDPLGPRLLRSAAALLCPHSAWLGGTAAAGAAGGAAAAALGPGAGAWGSGLVEDPLVPRLQPGGRLEAVEEGSGGGVAHGSVLLTAGNCGVAVVEAEQLTAKQRTQLCEVMARPSIPLAPDRPELTVPATPTVWAAACRTHTPDAPAGGGGGGRRGGVRGLAAPGCGWSCLEDGRFDVVAEHGPTDDVAAGMALDGGAGWGGAEHEGGGREGPDEAFLLGALRQHVAGAALLSPGPQLSEGALELLMRYYVAVRQSGVQVGQAELLRSLVRLATATARLHLRRKVVEAPDCVAAVLLTERTLAARFGSEYLGLGLPPLALADPAGAGFGGEEEEEEGEEGGGGGGGWAQGLGPPGAGSLDAALVGMAEPLGRCLQGFVQAGPPSVGW